MTDQPTATLLVADDMHVDLTGKFYIFGVYPTDIQIPNEAATAARLVFIFSIEGSNQKPFRSLTVEVTLPGSPPQQAQIPLPPNQQLLPGRSKMTVKFPLMVQVPVLRAGRIKAKVIHDDGEIAVSAPWIVVAAPPSA